MNILILGVNGFIGSHLSRRIVSTTDWHVYGMDRADNRIQDLQASEQFHFVEGDVSITKEWIEYHIQKCDVCLPLVAIATPATYVKDPLSVFKLDFEENLRIIRQCCAQGTRVIFPSSSEVYGMCQDEVFHPHTSNCVYGPITKQRWIYAASKQLLDRVIWAMGMHEMLNFTIFRPFNWIGPGLDDLNERKEGSSRVVTQFLGHLLRDESITVVDSGMQRRTFCYIDDGIEALMGIIYDCPHGEILNIGNPENDISMYDLAKLMTNLFHEISGRPFIPDEMKIQFVRHEKYYGADYQDMKHRVPDIELTKQKLNWEPKWTLEQSLRKTIEYYVSK